MKTLITFILSLCQLVVFAQNTRVDIISTLHKNHSLNKNYTYDNLINYIELQKPDIIALEIRSEDLDLPKETLLKRYPLEMIENLNKIPNVFYYGFDWYGDDIVGKPFPENYFDQENSIKKIQNEMNRDHAFSEKLSVLIPLTTKKTELIKSLSLEELKQGSFDIINEIYYQQIEILCKNSPYERISDFYKTRDLRLSENISKIIEKNPGKKILVLTGADHRVAIIKYIKEKFSNNIELLQ